MVKPAVPRHSLQLATMTGSRRTVGASHPCMWEGKDPLSTLYPYYMTLYLYPEGDGAPDKNIFTNGGPNIPMGYRGDVGLVGAPTPIRLVTLKNFYGLPGGLA